MPARIDRPHIEEVRIMIATVLKERRIALQMTQTALAALCRVPQPEISRIESGRFNPTIETVTVIAHELGLELSFSPHKKAIADARRGDDHAS